MNILHQVQDFLEKTDRNRFFYYSFAFLFFIFLINGSILFYYYRNMNKASARIKKINNDRTETKDLLQRFEIVKKQKMAVDALLTKDADFKIVGFFNDTIEKIGLSANKVREPETSSTELENGYIERKLYASFSNLNMQKIVTLLDSLEQKERIYIKEVEIYKTDKNPVVNLNILIATLEPQIEINTGE